MKLAAVINVNPETVKLILLECDAYERERIQLNQKWGIIGMYDKILLKILLGKMCVCVCECVHVYEDTYLFWYCAVALTQFVLLKALYK